MHACCLRSFLMGIALLANASTTAAAPLGTTFTYQGQLKKDGILIDGTAHLRFSLWDAAGSGSPPVGGSQIGASQLLANVGVTNGLFTVPLNAGGQFGASAFNGEARWLQIEVCADAGCGTLSILSPRQPLTAAPHALFAVSADRLDGLDSTAFVQSIPNPLTLSGTSAAHIIRGENASTTLASSGVFGLSTSTVGRTYGVFGQSDSTTGRGVFGSATAPSGFTYGGWFQTASTSGDGVVGQATASSGATYGVVGESFSTDGTGVFGFNNIATTGFTYGGRFECASTSCTGVSGTASAFSGETTGVYGQTYSPTGRGVYGDATFLSDADRGEPNVSAGPMGGAFGVYGSARAPTGVNYGVCGRSDSRSDNAGGVCGFATAETGTTYGGYFLSFSTSLDAAGVLGLGATGVHGRSEALEGYGVVGVSGGTSGRGVYGVVDAETGDTSGVHGRSLSPSGRGVYGEAVAASGQTRGVYGVSRSTGGWGVHGSATAGTGLAYGGLFDSSSTSGRGVFAQATAPTGGTYGGRFGSASTSGVGVSGVASAASGITYAVHGQCNSITGYDVYAGGAGIDYGSSSSIRWKSNVRNIDRSLEKVSRLRGVYFDWDAEHGGRHDLGMIAEEVGGVLPEIVGYEENGIDANAMDYSKLTPLLIEAVNEQQRRFEILRQEAECAFDEMRERESIKDRRIQELEARLATIEALLGRSADSNRGGTR